GGGRRYSLRDIETLRTVAKLTAEGIGLEGVKRVIALGNQVAALQQRVRELDAELADARTARNLPEPYAEHQIGVWRSRRGGAARVPRRPRPHPVAGVVAFGVPVPDRLSRVARRATRCGRRATATGPSTRPATCRGTRGGRATR